MQHVLTKFRIKKGKKEKVQKFLEGLKNNHLQESIETLEEARVWCECSFVKSTEYGDFLYIFKKLENLDHLKNTIANSKLPIYDKIRKWAVNCLESREDLHAMTVFER